MAPSSSSTSWPVGAHHRASDVDGWRRSHIGGPQGHELDRALAIGVSVTRLVRIVEPLREPAAQWHGQLERLPGVPQVRLADVGKLAGLGERSDVRAHGVPSLVGGNEAERGQDSGGSGNENARHSELVGERARVQRPGATEGDEGEVARVETLLDGDDAQRAHHLGVDDVDHPGRVDLCERPLGRSDIELDSAWQRRAVGVRAAGWRR